MPSLDSIDIIDNTCTFTCTNASTDITNTYTKYRYTNAIVSPLHTTYPHHRGGGRTYLSARLLYFVITYYILFPLPHNIPPPQGGGRTYLSAPLLYFVITYYILFLPPSTQHTTTGGEGGTMTIGGGERGVGGAGAYIYILYIHFTSYALKT